MVILVVNQIDVSVIEHKSNPPIAGDLYCPAVLRFWMQLVQTRAWKAHILDRSGSLEYVQDICQAIRMLGLNAFFRSIEEELFQTFMAE